MGAQRRKKILLIASGGGHWVQLNRLRPAFDQHDVAFVTVDASYRSDVPDARFYVVKDATRWNRVGLLRMALQVLFILLKERPHIVISTGAAPGFVGLRLGKLLGARTVWLDSIANVERLSLSGERIGPHAGLWLTQWPHLARPGGPRFEGAVL
ncbi:MAG: UDP-N-acetylglucosamine--LPS N-acetylglucosamine transferase [Planctomycetota bacterium]